MIKRIRNIDLLDVRVIGLMLMLVAFGSATYGYIEVHGDFDLLTVLSDFYANISAELGSIAITVLIIDGLSRRRDKREKLLERKERLLREVRSQSNETALSAVSELREHGWLEGLLKGANLSFAKLQGANLNFTDLQGVDLSFANLQGAKDYPTFDEETTLPDETKWTPGTDMTRFTDPEHPNFWRSVNPFSPASAYKDDDDQTED